MAFADPIVITIDAVAWNLDEISQNGQTRTYRDDTGRYELIISHQEGKRNRRTIRLNEYNTSADPFIPANNIEVSQSVYVVMDTPVVGFVPSDSTLFAMGLRNFLGTPEFNYLLSGQS